VCLGEVGIDDSVVYTVVQNDLCALIHDCPAQPYQSGDGEVTSAWVLAHHRVVEAAWERWGTVLPLAFNTIFRPGDKTGLNEAYPATQGKKAKLSSAQENLVAWLEREYPSLKRKLEALVGKAEYGVQVFWEPLAVARKIVETVPEFRKLEEEIESSPRGLAYMYRQKLERLLRKEMEARAAEEFKDLYSGLSCCVDHIHVEKTKVGGDGRQMLMNLSCLVSTERYSHLEAALEKISDREGFFLRLVGPLPTYSFC